MSISKRLLLMLVCAVGALLLVGGTGAVTALLGKIDLQTLNDRTLPSVQTIAQIDHHIASFRANVLQHVLNRDGAQKLLMEKAIKVDQDAANQGFANYESHLITNTQDKALLEEDKKAYAAFQQVMNQILEKSKNYESTSAIEMISDQGLKISDQMAAALAKHTEYNSAAAKKTTERSIAQTYSLLVIGLIIGLAGAVIISLVGLRLIKGIVQPLRTMQSTVTRIESEMDFTVRASVLTQDEVGQTAIALNRFLEKLRNNLRNIADGSQQVAQSASSLTETARQSAHAAELQNDAATTMATAVEEMSASIHHVGDRAAETNDLSSKSGSLAQSGTQVIHQTVRDINEIASTVESASQRIRELEQQSDKISSIIAVIREIADQTNLLALNAAIEAARAGEQGRGFAVVADEVRKLAERTSVATQDVGKTITGMRDSALAASSSMSQAVERVSAGVARAQDASQAIEKIGASSQQTVQMVSEITHAIQEQIGASQSISNQVDRIAGMADESSASARKSAAAAQDMDQIAAQMREIVASYKL